MNFKLIHYATFSLLVTLYMFTMTDCHPTEHGSHYQDDTNIDASEYHGNLSKDTILKLKKCDMDMEVMELCMRCAKITKSQFVYPLCCANEDDIQEWCKEYVYYGKRT